MEEVSAHALKNILGSLELFIRATNHEGEGTVVGARNTTRHRGVEESEAALLSLDVESLGTLRVDSADVADESSWLGAGVNTTVLLQGLLDEAGVGKSSHDVVHISDSLSEGVSSCDAFIIGSFARLGHDVVASDSEAIASQVL